MSSPRALTGILGDISLLYELALSVGTSLDLEENCDHFLGTLMARMNLSLASVWFHSEADGDKRTLSLAYCHPRFRVTDTVISTSHPLLRCLGDAEHVSVLASEPGLAGLAGMAVEEDAQGCFAVFRLGTLGVLNLYAATRAEPLQPRELNRLRNVFALFTVSLEGCLAHQQMTREVERRREAERALRVSEARYRELFRDSPSILFRLNSAGVIETVNAFGAQQLGWTPRELVGTSVFDLSPPEDRDAAFTGFSQVLGAEGLRESTRLRKVRRDGSHRWIDEVARCVSSPDGDQVLVIWHDITERVEREAANQRIEARLIESQKLESLGLMAGGIAHDFNNILTGILCNSEMALMELSEEGRARHYIEQVDRAGQRAADLCRQLLAYSGRGRFEVHAIDLSREVEDARGLLEMSVSRAVTVNYELASDLPAVKADTTQIRQLVINLITNAAEAVSEGGEIWVRTASRRCWSPDLEGAIAGEFVPGVYVVLEVEDSGSGMDEETQRRIFDPFFTTKFTGHGLGLAGVLGIVRGHSGSIQVKSHPGMGSLFTVYLPISAEPVRRAPGDRRVAAWQRGGAVLVVDDEPMVLKVCSDLLRRMGFVVIEAMDGYEAVRAFRDRPEIRFVIMDVTMPGMNGVEARRRLHEMRPGVPVLLSSGYSEAEVLKQMSSSGAGRFLHKPYTHKALEAELAELLAEDDATPYTQGPSAES